MTEAHPLETGTELGAILAESVTPLSQSPDDDDRSVSPQSPVILISSPTASPTTSAGDADQSPRLPDRVRRAFPNHAPTDPRHEAAPAEAVDDDHLRRRLQLLSRGADAVVFEPGWEYDGFCAVEYIACLLGEIPAFDADGDALIPARALTGLSRAVESLGDQGSESGRPTEDLLRQALAWVTTYNRVDLKDRQLRATSDDANTAYFASYAAHTAWFRHSNLPHELDRRRLPVVDTIRELVALSASSTVNVRTFRLDAPQGNPFHYGLTDAVEAADLVRRLALDGYFVIVNETVDQHDGGISGVSLNGVVEFAPDTTPRTVEQAGSCRTSVELATQILTTVYGPSVLIPDVPGRRIEFSCHPHRVGVRRGQTLTWETVDDTSVIPSSPPQWPNAFSRHIGDKAFGLLVAHLHGATVPKTTVISRRVAPFEFGTSTGTGEWWIRTAPAEAQPGLFTTERGWRDPFELLNSEDPERMIASVLSQESVDAVWSGASAPRSDAAEPLLEGVAGYGDDFMLGRQHAEPIPTAIAAAVTSEIRRLEAALGRVRIEWVWDGRQVWVVQLHRMGSTAQDVLSGGAAKTWLPYDPADGLDVLRVLVLQARSEDAGVLVTRPVGITSHVGDILRKANVPGRFGTADDHT